MPSKQSNQLNHLRVLNTRPLEQNQPLSKAIQDAGGISIELPAIVIEPLISWQALMPALSSVDQAIFTSANAVNHYFSALEQQKITWPNHINVTAIGNASASALCTRHIRAAHVPNESDSEHLIQLPILQQVHNQTILLVKGEGGRPVIADTMLARGAHLIALNVYRRITPQYSTNMLRKLWQNDAVDIILFTSQQAMQNLYDLFSSAGGYPWLCSKPCIVISKRLAEIAASLGIRTILLSHYGNIIDSLYEYKQGIMHGDQQ